MSKRHHLTDALSIDVEYLRNNSDSREITDFRHWQIPLSRRFRALKIWFVMRNYGLSGFREYIRNHINIGNLFSSLVMSRPDLFRIVTPPAFALTAFQIVPPATEAGSTAKANALTKAVYEGVHRTGEIMFTSTTVGGIYIIRIICANPNTEEKYIRLAFSILVDTVEKFLHDGRRDTPKARL